MRRVAVIGGGYAGTAFAIHLARAAPRPLDVVVVEPREQVGGGLAHSAVDPDHRLNAPDVVHFLYPDDPMHFRRWLETSGRQAADPAALHADGRLYPRRGDFGAYVSSEFAGHAASNPSGSILSHRRTRAVAIDRRPGGFRIQTADGGLLEATRCVVAVGHEPAPAKLPGLRPEAAGERVIAAPLDPGALRSIPPDADVLVLGTGLTAADAVASLLGQGHRGRITCVSRHGVRPTEQNPAKPQGPIWDQLTDQPPAFVREHGLPTHLRALSRLVRDEARARMARGEPWQGAIDEIRDAAGEIWRALDVGQKARFQRHLKPYYDGHRFRIPPQTRDLLGAAEETGQLDFRAARIVDASLRRDGLWVTLRPRGAPPAHPRRIDYLVNCHGFETRIAHSRNPFLQSCLGRGLVGTSDMGRGFSSDAAGRALGPSGAPTEGLYVIGAMTLDRFGETPAAIFILRQILRLLPGFLAAWAPSPTRRRGGLAGGSDPPRRPGPRGA